ncbi:MAG: transcription elongation factor GreA [Candidatus Moraniibacteriota bacterium]
MPKILTKDGYKKIEDELEMRKIAMRQEIASAIKEAKEQGDLSENAEYSEAKRRQNENESRIMELEATLKDSIVAMPKSRVSGVQMGSTITVKVSGKERVFVIVGSNEVDPAKGLISNESPLGRAFMGHDKGETVEVEVPAGKLKYEIVSIA